MEEFFFLFFFVIVTIFVRVTGKIIHMTLNKVNPGLK